MSIIKSEDSKKWINALVAVFSIIVGIVVIKFATQVGAWFDLEAKIPNYVTLTQAVGIVLGAVSFFVTTTNKKTSNYLEEVYHELTKVTWPTKEATTKITVGLFVALVICSAIFLIVDLIFKKLIGLII